MIGDAESDTTQAVLGLPRRTIIGQVGFLAIPVFVEQVLLYLVGFSDTLLTGRRLGVDPLAAVTVCSYLLWFLGSLMIVVSAGATALVSRLIGGGHRQDAVRITRQSISLAAIVGVIIGVTAFLGTPALIAELGLRGQPAAQAVVFFRIILLITPLQACETVGVACLRGAGDTRTGMWVMLLVNAINVALSWSLAVGIGPIPALGLPGVAIGTACGEGAGGLVVLAVLARGRSGLSLSMRGMIPQWHDVRRIMRISLPAAGESLTNGLCQLWFLGLINRLGPTATAAHGVAIRCEAIAYLTVTSFAVASSTLTGQYLGARRPDLARRAGLTAWALGLLLMLGLGILLFAAAEPMFALFLGRPGTEVARLGVPVLRLVSFALPALATINVLSGALRGAGDTRWPMAIVLAGYLLVRIPLTAWLTTPTSSGGLGWSLFGAWVAMLADLNVRGLLIALRYLHGGWRTIRV